MNKWYLKPGKDFDIVFSVRLRIARNLSQYPFPNKMSDEQKYEVIQKISDCIFKSKYANDYSFVDVNRLEKRELFSLAHRHLISFDFAQNPTGRALILKNDESLSIMINEEDHIRIQSICSGLEFENAYNDAEKIETLLNEVSNKMMLINDGETEIYDGYKKPSELRGELDQFRQTFHITHEQIVKSAGDIIATANTMENQ